MTISQQDEIVTLSAGAIILAPGFEPFDPSHLETYGYGRHPDVITSMAFERILSASGPTMGQLKKPSDGLAPHKIAWIQCVGSRGDNKKDHGYCSSVCCMYAIKEAVIAKEHAHNNLDCAIFYMDMRTGEKEFDRYYMRARDELGVRFIRSRIHSIETKNKENQHLGITFATEKGLLKTESFDMVILSIGLSPASDLPELATKLGISLDSDGFRGHSGKPPGCNHPPGDFRVWCSRGPPGYSSVGGGSLGVSGCRGKPAGGSAQYPASRKSITPKKKDVTLEPPRIGVFVCHCGINIAGVVDVPAVRTYAKTLPGVVYAEDNLFTCSQDTQERIRNAINERNLNRVVVAACTPRTHEPLFQETLREAGLKPLPV